MNEQTPPERDTSEPSPRPKKRLLQLSKTALFFGIIAIIFVTVYCVINLQHVSAFFSWLGNLLTPVIIGGVIAYLCNPILEFYEYRVLRRMKRSNLRRGLSLFLAIATVVGIIALILLMVIPELIESIKLLASNYESYVDSLLNIIKNIINSITAKFDLEAETIQDVQELKDMIANFFGSGEAFFDKVISFITEHGIASGVGNTLMSVLNTFKNLILGIFIALYILASKEKRVAQIRKFRKAVFSEKQNQRITEVSTLISHTFDGYVFGVLIDALIVGILTFTLLSIFSVTPSYNLLIATICAVTNIIPVFGPFIGAIPSAFIVLISNPSKFFLFIILILIIQQIDGNLLLPKIQGDNTGISSLAVLIAITIAGSQWGVLGMVVGVPICAVIIELVKRFLDRKLEAMGEPTDTVAYYPEDALGNAEKDVHYEHAGLLYRYEHSKIKPRLEKLKNRLYSFFRIKRSSEEEKAAKQEKASASKKKSAKKTKNYGKKKK